MAMPRPSGRALKIAEEVIPALKNNPNLKHEKRSKKRNGSMSYVEAKQTELIERK